MHILFCIIWKSKFYKVIGERPRFLDGRTNGPTDITPFTFMIFNK